MFLITGGAGFIGSYLAKEIQSRQLDDFVVVDWLGSDAKWHHMAGLHPWDIVRPEELFSFLAKNGAAITKVVHMGAISSTTAIDGDDIYKTNVALPNAFLRWCAKHQVPFIYASSAATYGGGEYGFEDKTDLTFLRDLRPLNLYGWSKNLFDMNVMQRANKKKPMPPQWAGLKFFNVYGPHEDHKGGQSSVVYHLFGQVHKAERAKLFKSHNPAFKDGEQQRDFVYVKDCVDVMLWLLENPEVSGLFNVGTGQARTFNDLARATFSALDLPEHIDYIPTPHEIRDKYQYYTQADMTKLRGAGYKKPFHSLEDGVKDYIQEYLLKKNF